LQYRTAFQNEEKENQAEARLAVANTELTSK
jgi:hypothetical protein